jgi:hypothetical protein
MIVASVLLLAAAHAAAALSAETMMAKVAAPIPSVCPPCTCSCPTAATVAATPSMPPASDDLVRAMGSADGSKASLLMPLAQHRRLRTATSMLHQEQQRQQQRWRRWLHWWGGEAATGPEVAGAGEPSWSGVGKQAEATQAAATGIEREVPNSAAAAAPEVALKEAASTSHHRRQDRSAMEITDRVTVRFCMFLLMELIVRVIVKGSEVKHCVMPCAVHLHKVLLRSDRERAHKECVSIREHESGQLIVPVCLSAFLAGNGEARKTHTLLHTNLLTLFLNCSKNALLNVDGSSHYHQYGILFPSVYVS